MKVSLRRVIDCISLAPSMEVSGLSGNSCVYALFHSSRGSGYGKED
jgi:hypothetical protein